MNEIGKTKGTFERETKRMVRYATDWGVIYLPKVIFGENGYPEDILVSVSLDE